MVVWKLEECPNQQSINHSSKNIDNLPPGKACLSFTMYHVGDNLCAFNWMQCLAFRRQIGNMLLTMGQKFECQVTKMRQPVMIPDWRERNFKKRKVGFVPNIKHPSTKTRQDNKTTGQGQTRQGKARQETIRQDRLTYVL